MTEEFHLEYSIPKEYKKKLNKAFISSFMHYLSGIWDDESLDDVIAHEQGTNGWYEAFTKACFATGNAELSAYYHRLEWRESDRFDIEFSEMIYNAGFARRIDYEKSKNT